MRGFMTMCTAAVVFFSGLFCFAVALYVASLGFLAATKHNAVTSVVLFFVSSSLLTAGFCIIKVARRVISNSDG